MNTKTAFEHTRRVRLKEDRSKVRHISLRYELNAIKVGGRRCYAITVDSGYDRCTCCFGEDKKAAMEMYRTIVENTVTPCTLHDIAEDFSHICKHKRY